MESCKKKLNLPASSSPPDMFKQKDQSETLLKYFKKGVKSSLPQASQESFPSTGSEGHCQQADSVHENGTTSMQTTGKDVDKEEKNLRQKLELGKEEKNIKVSQQISCDEPVSCVRNDVCTLSDSSAYVCVPGSLKNETSNVEYFCGNPVSSQSTSNPKNSALDPFQILMQSSRKKGVWSRNETKAKDMLECTSEEVVTEQEKSMVQPPSPAKYFSIFSRKASRQTEETPNYHADMQTTVKPPSIPQDVKMESQGIGLIESHKSAQVTTAEDCDKEETLELSIFRSSPHCLVSAKALRPKRKQPSQDPGEPEKKKWRNVWLPQNGKGVVQTDAAKSKQMMLCKTLIQESSLSLQDGMTAVLTKTPPNVSDDNDFEMAEVRHGQQKIRRRASKSLSAKSRKTQPDRLSVGDSTVNHHPPGLSTAQKLVKKCHKVKARPVAHSKSAGRSPGRRSAGARKAGVSRSAPAVISGRRAGPACGLGAPPSEEVSRPRAVSGEDGTPRRRSARVSSGPQRPAAAPSTDSEAEFTPGRGAGRRPARARQRGPPDRSQPEASGPNRPSRRAGRGSRPRRVADGQAQAGDEKRSDRRPARPGSQAEPTSDGPGTELTPVKRPVGRSGGRGRASRPRQSEVETTPAEGRGSGRGSCRRDAPDDSDVTEITPVKTPSLRPVRNSRLRVLSVSEAEVTPVKDQGRWAARYVRRPESQPSDSELELTPVKKTRRQSGRSVGRPRQQPGNGEPTETPEKEPLRRSARCVRRPRPHSDSELEVTPVKKAGRPVDAADEVVVLDGPPARQRRPGVDAFQLLRRGGRPAPAPAPPPPAESPGRVAARRAFLSSGVPDRLVQQAEVTRRLEESLTPLFPEISHVQQRTSDAVWSTADPVWPELGRLSWRTGPELPPGRPAAASQLTQTSVRDAAAVQPSPAGLACVEAESGPAAGVDDAGGAATGAVRTECEPAADADSRPEPAAVSTASYRLVCGPPDAGGATSSQPPAAAEPEPLEWPEAAPALHRLLAARRQAGDAEALWSDMFRPREPAAFVGGAAAAAGALLRWLDEWQPPAAAGWDELSDEPAADGTVLLLGPTGSGKTSAVYSVAAQLGFQVLEVSASSRRSGRQLSSRLAEATQSHKLSVTGRPGGGAGVESDADSDLARSLLLLEDVQLVSEELDDGFLAAAASLAAAAKRPVVLTSSDPAVVRTRLLRALPHRLIRLAAAPAGPLRRRLALAALAQGRLLTAEAGRRLAAAAGGDVRRALLQLQWACESAGRPVTVDTGLALPGAGQAELAQLPATLQLVTEPALAAAVAAEPPLPLPWSEAGRRPSGWQEPRPVADAVTVYGGERRRRWRLVDPDLFSDDEPEWPEAPPQPARPEPTSRSSPPPPPPPAEENGLLAASVAALAGLWELRSAADALVAPAEPDCVRGWWRSGPLADMAECEQPRSVAAERAGQRGRQMAATVLQVAGRRCACQLQAARAEFARCGRSEPAAAHLVRYDEQGLREAVWDDCSRVTPAVPSLLLSRRVVTTDLLPSIRRICRLECGRRARDGGRTRRFLHYLDQVGLHLVPSELRSEICKSLV